MKSKGLSEFLISRYSLLQLWFQLFSMMGTLKLDLLIWVLIFSSILCVVVGFNPVDNYLIDCGSRTNTSVDGGRVFLSDDLSSRFLSTPQNIIASTNSNSTSTTIALPLYKTARIFNRNSSFTLPIRKHGRHWIRLYFFPFAAPNFELSKAIFSVSTQEAVLLRNFQLKNSSTVKEFSVNITSDDLILTFTPSSNSFAFLNALEVVSAPDNLIPDDARSVSRTSYNGLLSQTLETIYRVNIGGSLISMFNDTLWRTWVPDDEFLPVDNLAKTVSNTAAVKYQEGLSTEDTAPVTVYGTARETNPAEDPSNFANVTWSFSVDDGFEYLIRFHFCYILSRVSYRIIFNVYVNSWVAFQDLEPSSVTNNVISAPFYKDFVTGFTNGGMLSVSVGPSRSTDAASNAFLNGLEVMKLVSVTGPSSSSRSGLKSKVGLIVGVAIGSFVIVVFVLLFLICRRQRRVQKAHSKAWIPLHLAGDKTKKYTTNGTTTIHAGSSEGYRFPFAVMQEATNNFDESWVIGVGGFGKVYKGLLEDGTKIAVKRGNPQSNQGLAEFRTEIEMLSHFRHRHLVSLIGFCEDRNEMILVYEYMENGTLKSHLYGSDFPSLSWKQRLEICVGSARGLHYLHTGSTKSTIHRDVKSANILLDENFMAKVADFGLSKAGPEIDQTHVSTAVKGSFGYLDPEYFRRQQLTEKSDVYSFGVVLFEVICARAVIDPSLPREMVNLAEWALKWQKNGQLEQIIDPRLMGQIRPDSLRKFGETAEKCLADYGVDRPTMGDVLWNLEYVLRLQEVENPTDSNENSVNLIILSPDVDTVNNSNSSNNNKNINNNNTESAVTSSQLEMSSLDDLSGVPMSRVFSQLLKSEGR